MVLDPSRSLWCTRIGVFLGTVAGFILTIVSVFHPPGLSVWGLALVVAYPIVSGLIMDAVRMVVL